MTPHYVDGGRPPLEPGLPVAVALASLTAAGVCAIPPLEDKAVLCGLFLVVAAVSAVAAVVTALGGRREAPPHG